MTKRHPQIINVEDADVRPMNKGQHKMLLRRLGGPAGSQALGAVHTTVEPGGRSFPFHAHTATEEAVFIIAGSGQVRLGDATLPVRQGDWIAFPVGLNNAHQMINTGTVPLQYLCVSTMASTDLVVYPDSHKMMVTEPDSAAPLGFKRHLFRKDVELEDYWDGEPFSK